MFFDEILCFENKCFWKQTFLKLFFKVAVEHNCCKTIVLSAIMYLRSPSSLSQSSSPVMTVEVPRYVADTQRNWFPDWTAFIDEDLTSATTLWGQVRLATSVWSVSGRAVVNRVWIGPICTCSRTRLPTCNDP